MYRTMRCLVRRSHLTLLLWGWRRKSHHSHIATLHREDQWISVPEYSTKQWYLAISTRWCYGLRGSDKHRCASPFVSAAGDFSFRWCAMASSFTGPNSSRLFFCGVIWKVKCTVIALQTYIHSKRTYGKKSPNFQKKHLEPLCAAS